MRTHIVRGHKGYDIDLIAKPAPDNRFYSTFTIRRPSSDTGTSWSLVYSEDKESNVIFSTEHEALTNAEQRAKAWIDGQSG